MQSFYKSLVVLILLALTLPGCKKTNENDVLNPEEKGQFKIVLSDYLPITQKNTKAEHKEWESTLKSVHLYAIERSGANGVNAATTDPCVYYHAFSTKELTKTTAVFSIPNVKYGYQYDFYVVANTTTTAPADPTTTTRATIEALIESGRMSDYNGAYGTMADGTFFSAGKGFAMSGKATQATPSQDDTKPTAVKIYLNRLVAKLEVVCNITQAFKDKYTDGVTGHGGTFTITSVEVTNAANQATIMPVAMSTATPNANLETITQAAAYTGDACSNLFYFYENGTAATSITKIPRLVIRATYTFDGNPDIPVVYDNAVMDLEGEAKNATTPGAKGLFLRNARYTVTMNINGLTPSEVVATIEVNDWAVAINQQIDFGS